MTPRLRDLGPWVSLFATYRGWIAAGLALSAVTLLGALGLLGLSGGFLASAAAAALVPGGVLAFDMLIPAGTIRVFALTRTVGRWAERVVNHEVTFRVLGRIRVLLYRRLARLSPRQQGWWHGAAVLNRLTRDIDLLDNLSIRLAVPWGAALLVMAATVAWAWSVGFAEGVSAAVLGVLGLGILPVVLFLAGKHLAPRAVESHERLRTVLLDAVEGLDDLFGHRPAWNAQIARVRAEDARRFRLQTAILRWGASGRAVVTGLAGAAAFAVLSVATSSGAGPDAPWIIAVVLVLLGSADALGGLVPASLELSGTAHAAARLSALSEQEPCPGFPASMVAPVGADLRFNAVSFWYEAGNPVLSRIDFSLPLGSHVALTGPSGGGKSSLLSLIARLEDPTEGEVTLGGTPLTSYTEPVLRSLVGGCLQQPWAFSGTLAENLRIAAPLVDDDTLWQRLELVGLAGQVRAWPERLETWIGEGGQNLSGGQRKRLALARTLLSPTAVTVLDEPTEGLEHEAAIALVRAVRRELEGRTLIWVTHRPEGIAEFPRRWSLSSTRLVESLN